MRFATRIAQAALYLSAVRLQVEASWAKMLERSGVKLIGALSEVVLYEKAEEKEKAEAAAVEIHEVKLVE